MVQVQDGRVDVSTGSQLGYSLAVALAQHCAPPQISPGINVLKDSTQSSADVV
jgi:hypothetical protein